MKGKDKTKEQNTRPTPKGFVSIGMRKPFISNMKSKTIVVCVPEHLIKQNKYQVGDEVELMQNGEGDLLVRFQEK